MRGVLASLCRHPVKGFTPEALDRVDLYAGEGVPFDRAYAVEDGPSGFDPAAPAHISKMCFTVLAKIPEVARVRTRFDETTHTLHATAPNAAPIATKLNEEDGRDVFAAWLTDVLGDAIRGPLRVLPAPGAHRFYDDEAGFISLINLESVRELGRRIDRDIDPLRFRANLYIEGWPPWSELELKDEVKLGQARARVVKPIPRCVATHVHPGAGVRDLDVLDGLRRAYGHVLCGVYLRVEAPGALRVGDAIEAA
ncbi:MAG TPA: MOSC domain-containing protein [Caulobacterales bacterium]|nr:MOSC domain-containing protein [Caulobacterales bacterium]